MLSGVLTRARGFPFRLGVLRTFGRRRGRVSLSTSVLLSRRAGLRLGCGAMIYGHGSIALEDGATLAVGDRSCIMQNAEIVLAKGARVEVGDDVYIGAFANIRASGRIRIGSNSRVAQFVSLIGGQYEYKSKARLIREQGFRNADVQIGDDTWLGAGVIILGGITVGNGAVIGAGSVVTHDVPPYAIAVGNPARIVGARQ